MTSLGISSSAVPWHGRRADIGRVVQRWLPTALLATLGVALIAGRRQAQLGEAWLQGHLLTLFGMHVQRIQTSVLFDVKGHLAGISLTAGCTTGPLLGIFFLATAVLSAFRSLPLRRVFVGAAELSAVFLLANQLRIGAIVLAMRRWGFRRGYEFSHVFLGSAITTIGFVMGLFIFVRLVVRRPQASPS